MTDADLPLRLDAPAAMAVVRELLARHEYHEPVVARRLGGTTLYGVPRLDDGRTTLAGPVEDGQAALVRLFLDERALPASQLAALWGDDAVAAMHALGLLEPAPGTDGALRAAVLLYPTQGLWLVSDRQTGDGPGGRSTRQDYVFSAINELTRDFLRLVPAAPGQRVLELCSGTGIGALLAARRGAAEAWATDLIPRCVHMAQFNAQLNALDDRVRVVQSDVWEALAGETFDLVIAHPPYVPALSHRFDFRDAGADGEHVTRRIVEGLATHLRPGGRCVLRAALSDRRDAPIAQRVRAWLGDAGAEFDLVTLESGVSTPLDMYRTVTGGGKDFVDCERWLRHFDALGIERFVVCGVELRRDARGRAPITERRVAGAAFDAAGMDWQFRWAHFHATAGDTPLARVRAQRPRVAPGSRLAVHLASDAAGDWHTVGAALETAWPSHAVVKAPALAPTLLELCDGTRDVPALLGGLRAHGLVNEGVTEADVANLVEVLAGAGIVELPACPLPPRPDA